MANSLPRQKKLISISETAKFLGVSLDTVRRWDKLALLHSERPDGKNRFFSLDELKKFKFGQPLSITEAAAELGVSATTLRRLEDRGLIKPNRNNAGERIFDKESVESFLNSGYFLRKKQAKEKILPDFQPEKNDAVSSIKDYSLEVVGLAKKNSMRLILKPLQMMPGFLAATVIFILLTAIGITNIQASTIRDAQILPPAEIVSEQVQSEEEVATIPLEPEVAGTASALITVPVPASPSAEEEKPEPLQVVKISSNSSALDDDQKTATNSAATGRFIEGQAYEVISVDSKGYHVKLADGSTGFIPFQEIEKEEVGQ